MTEREFSRRSTNLAWDETMLDYAAIEKRAQEMRAEAAWGIARAVREWAVTVFGQGKATARAVVRTPLERHGQAT